MVQEYSDGGDFGSGPGGTNPFENANAFTWEVGDFVAGKIDQIDLILNDYLAKANTAIEALGGWNILLPTDPVAPPELDPTFDYAFEIPTPDGGAWGAVPEWNLPPDPNFTGDSSVTVPNFPDFDPTYVSITIPPPPPYTIGPAPSPAPTVATPEFPDPPELGTVDLPTLLGIDIPETPVIVIDDFVPILPDFTMPAAPNAGINWPGEEYVAQIMDDVLAQIRVFFAGGTGIRADVQDGMYRETADREDRITHQAVQEVEDTFSSRGFVVPPGVLLSRIDALRDERDRTKSTISRTVLIKAMDAELENLRFATTAGIQAERLYVDLFLAAQERLFLVQQLTVQYGIQLYSYQVQAYLAAFEAVKIQVEVYKAQIEGKLAQVELYKAQIDAELAKTEINKNLVDMYVAQINALQTQVNLYVAELMAVKTRVEVDATRVDAFGKEVDAYAALVSAEKIKFDAYESQIKGEVAKVSITEAESRAYAAHMGGLSAGVNAEARAVEANIGKYTADIRKYVGQIEGLNAQSQTVLAGIQANVAGYQALTSRYNAEAGLQEAMGRVELAVWDGWNDTQIENYRANISLSEVNLRRVIEEARLAQEALASSGQLATQVVGGSLAAMHVGASISGSGSTSASGNLSESFQWSESASVSEGHSTSCAINQDASIVQNLEAGDAFGGTPWGECG